MAPARVFLDTNVVLTGAFIIRGPAGTLGTLSDTIKFLHSPRVLAESDYLISRDAPSGEICDAAKQQVRVFLAQLHSEAVDDCSPPVGISARDPDDNLLLGSAIAANADTICTYNIKDFPNEPIAVRTPLSVNRAVAAPALEHFIQPVELSSCGTMLFFGSLHHSSSMGPIVTSHNGTSITADEQGFIQLTGPTVSRNRPLKPLRANEEFRLSIRYNETDFEAALWTKPSANWTKEVLSNGAGSFSESTSAVLFFVPNHRFYGHIQCLSGLPRYVRDKHLHTALDNYSLEAIAGSLDLKWFLQRVVRP